MMCHLLAASQKTKRVSQRFVGGGERWPPPSYLTPRKWEEREREGERWKGGGEKGSVDDWGVYLCMCCFLASPIMDRDFMYIFIY